MVLHSSLCFFCHHYTGLWLYTPLLYHIRVYGLSYHYISFSNLCGEIFLSTVLRISNFVVTLLSVILCLFSYHTSRSAITFTFILYFVIKIFTNYVERHKKIENKPQFLVIVTVILFLLFDNTFILGLGLSFNDAMMFS